jgi:hypothetical protein
VSLKHIGLLAWGAVMLLASALSFAAGEPVAAVLALLFGLVSIVVPVAERVPDGSGPRLEDGALVVRVQRVRRGLLLLGTVLFTALSAVLLVAPSGFGRIAGGLGVLTFGTFMLVGLWQLRGPWRLVLTPHVLRWDQGGDGPPVAWEDITGVGKLVIAGSPTMTIRVARPHELRMGALARWLRRVNRRMGGGDVNVPLNQLAVDDDLLLSLVTVCAREPQARGTLVSEATVRRLQA